jgi:DNA ligase-1
MKTLPVLYSKRSDGGVQTWKIEIEGNRYRAISGTADGKQVVNAWTVCQGKNIGRANETTPEQQAQAEAQALWTKKRDKGYKIDKNEIDDKGFFAPMLAQKYEDRQDLVTVSFPNVYSNPKLDGMRAITTKQGMFSRMGKVIKSSPHIYEALKPVFAKYPDAVFDGELYCDKFCHDFSAIISLAKQTKPTAEDLRKSAENLQYHTYDFLLYGKNSLKEPFSQRYRNLLSVLTECRINTNIIVPVEAIQVKNQQMLDDLYGGYLESGYEGQIIRLDEPYENKRSKFLLKRKEFQDQEFIIGDILEGVGNRSGMAGFMTFKDAEGRPLKNKKGEIIKAGLRGNRAYFIGLLKNKRNYVGKKATVAFFGKTADGSLRFPVVLAVRDYE